MERRSFLSLWMLAVLTACKNRIEGTGGVGPPACPAPHEVTRDGQCVQTPAQPGPLPSAPGPVVPHVTKAGTGELAGLKVTLDVGHGMENGTWDSGAVAKGLVEYELNRDEAMMIAELLRAKGTQVRVNDYKNGSKGPTLSQKGMAAGDAHIFVSLHHNAANASAQGSEVWHHIRGSRSDRELATAIQKRLAKAIWGSDSSRDRGVKSKVLGVLGGVPKSTKASCLTESFFVDGAQASKSTSATWAKNAAKGIAEGIEDFWTSKKASLALYGDDFEDEWPATPYPESEDLAGHHDDH